MLFLVTMVLATPDGGTRLINKQVEAGMNAAKEVPLTPAELLPAKLPIFPLRGGVLMPGGSLPLRVGRPETVALVQSVGIGGLLVALPLRRADQTDLTADAFFGTGCFARIVSIQPSEGSLMVVLQGIRRVHVANVLHGNAAVQEQPDEPAVGQKDAAELTAFYRKAMDRPPVASAEDWEAFLQRIERATPADQTFAIASNLNLPFETQQQLFELTDPRVRIARLRRALEQLHVPLRP
jgi:Lon protease-like protein